jgi:hypothetical protein
VLTLGSFRLVAATDHVLTYERRLDDHRVLVALNMSEQARSLPADSSVREALISTYLDDPRFSKEEINLRPHEGLVLRVHAEVT